jgi:hypothetical protein
MTTAVKQSERDVEAQTTEEAVPAFVVAEPTTIQRIRIYEVDVPRGTLIAPEDPAPYLLPCAIVGCAFSWIPIIGCVTWAVNCNAPPNSPRRFWATMACAVAMTIALFNIIFWSSSSTNGR